MTEFESSPRNQVPLKILFVVHGFPPKSVAGTELHNLALARELSHRNRVFVYSREIDAATPDYTTRDEQRGPLTIHWMNHALRNPWERPEEAYLNERIAKDFDTYMELAKPDIVHIAHTAWLTTSVVEIAVARKIPVALQLNDFYYVCHRIHLYDIDDRPCSGPETGEKCARCIASDTIPRLSVSGRRSHPRRSFKINGFERKNYMQQLLRLPQIIFAPSEFVKEWYVEFGVPQERIQLCPYGIEPFRPRAKVSSSQFRFGFLGHLFIHKGPRELIEAFRGLGRESVRLLLYGEGEATFVSKLRQRARGRNVAFMNIFPHERLPEVLASLDAVVVPSRCHESFSFVIREAMMGGLPVVVSDLRAQSDAINEGVNGLHFRAGNEKDLRDRMRLIVDDHALYNRLANGARETVTRTVENEAQFIEARYRELVAST